MFKPNPLTLIDFYKADHRRQYPNNTEYVYSNFTPRSDRLFKGSKFWDGKITWVGMAGFIKEFLVDLWNDEFFNKPLDKVLKRYKRRLDNALGKDAVPIEHIEALHKLGFLPLCIKSLPEGSRVNMKVPVFTCINTLPNFGWLVNYLETLMSAEGWKPATNAAIAGEYFKVLSHYAKLTGAPLGFVALQGHDFSFRGMSGVHDAARAGTGHLTYFVGTDTVPTIDYLEDYYDIDSDKELIGCSVYATEHSVMCAGGKVDELATFKRLITELYPTGIVSIVSDTWDFWKVITEYTVVLKEDILNRKPNELGLAKVVFRPDSGDPVKILTGYLSNEYMELDGKFYCVQTREELLPAEVKGAVECLWDIFGGTVTNEGYRVLHERVGLIYGDSITIERAEQILHRLMLKGFASCNTVFGIGLM